MYRVFAVLLCIAHFVPAYAQDKGLFWQISPKDGVAPSYLFGTIHSADPRVTRLPAVVETKFKQADSVSLETLMNLANIMRLNAAMMTFSPAEQLHNLLPAEDYERVLTALKAHDVPAIMAKNLKPWAVMLTLSMPKTENKDFLDLLLYQRAHEAEKALYGLETVEEQLTAFEAMSLQDQVKLLLSTLDYLEELPDIFEKLHRLYLARDLGGMLKLMNQQINSSSEQALMRTFYNALLDKRNTRMLERIQPRLAEGNAFIAVGAAHLAGEKGLVNLLETAGYAVKRLY